MNADEDEATKNNTQKGTKKQRSAKSRRKELLACASNANPEDKNLSKMCKLISHISLTQNTL